MSIRLSLLTFSALPVPVLAQTPNPYTVAPYGGVLVTPGQLAPPQPNQPAANLPAANPPAGTGVCPLTASPGCVLTGQYNRYRQSTNHAEPTLANPANITKYSTSGLWGYSINSSTATLTNIFSPALSASNAGICPSLPSTLPTSWTPSSFADPTLANGRIYMALSAASNGSGAFTGGVIQVFGVCQ